MRTENIRANLTSLGLYTPKNEKKISFSGLASEQPSPKLAGEKSADFEWNTTKSRVDIPIRDGNHTSAVAMDTQIPTIELTPPSETTEDVDTFSTLDTEKRGLGGLTTILEKRLATASTPPQIAKEINHLKDAMVNLCNEVEKNAIYEEYEEPKVDEKYSTNMLDKYTALEGAAQSAQRQAESISKLAEKLNGMVDKKENSEHAKLASEFNTISNIYGQKAKIYCFIKDEARINATSTYDKNNKLKHIFHNPDNSSSRTEIGAKVKFGAGLPTYGMKLLDKAVSASLTANVGGKHSSEVSMKNGAGSTAKKDTLSTGIDTRVGIKGLSASAGVAGNISVGETYDTGKTNPERDFAIIEALEESRRSSNLPFLQGPKAYSTLQMSL